MIHEIEILMKIASSLKVTCQHCSYSTYTFNLRFLILKLGFQNLKKLVPERIHFHSTPLIWPLIGQKILGCASREYKDITMSK